MDPYDNAAAMREFYLWLGTAAAVMPWREIVMSEPTTESTWRTPSFPSAGFPKRPYKLNY